MFGFIKKAAIFLVCLVLILSFRTSVYAGSPPDASHSTFSANPTTVASDGSATSTIQITLRDSNNNGLNGDSVYLVAPNDGNAVFSPSSANLDSGGSVTFTVKSSTSGTDQINLIDSTTGTTLSSFGSVTFTSGAIPTPTPTCDNLTPGAPNLTVAVTSGTNSIKLTWIAPTIGDVSYYLISYGITSGQYAYGNPNVGNVTTYTVDSLTAGKKYYFVVKGADSCGSSGDYSNEISATVGATATAAPTTTYTSDQSTDSSEIPTETPFPTDTPEPTPSPTEVPSPSIFANIGDIKAPLELGALVLIALGVMFFYWKPEAKNKIFKIFNRKRRIRSDE